MVQLIIGSVLVFSGRLLNQACFPVQNGTLYSIPYPVLDKLWKFADDYIKIFGYYASLGDILQVFGLALCIFWVVNTHLSGLRHSKINYSEFRGKI